MLGAESSARRRRKCLPRPRPPTSDAGDDLDTTGARVSLAEWHAAALATPNSDLRLAVNRKLLQIHVPLPTVETKPAAESLDIDVPEPNARKPFNDPKYKKYFKMLKMHVPCGAIEAKMDHLVTSNGA